MHFCSKSGVILAVIVSLLMATQAEEKINKQIKRQIYREQVLPHAGGRIPDTAFETDRLFLNRLQKDGISVPDGIVTEQRSPQVYPYLSKSSRTVYRIALSSDARFTPGEGRYQHTDVPSVETTYLYPPIHTQNIHFPRPTYKATTRAPPAYPVYRQFHLHNPLLNQVRYQPRKKSQVLAAPTMSAHSSPAASSAKSTATSSRVSIKSRPKSSYKTTSYQNFNLLNSPLSPTAYGISRRSGGGVGGGHAGSNHILDVPTAALGAAATATSSSSSSSSLPSAFYKRPAAAGVLRIGSNGADSDGDVDANNNGYLPQQYESAANLFSEFDRYFNDFDLHDAGSPLQYRTYSSATSTADGGAATASAIATATK